MKPLRYLPWLVTLLCTFMYGFMFFLIVVEETEDCVQGFLVDQPTRTRSLRPCPSCVHRWTDNCHRY